MPIMLSAGAIHSSRERARIQEGLLVLLPVTKLGTIAHVSDTHVHL